MQFDSGHEAKEFDEEMLKKMRKNFTGYDKPQIKVTPGGWKFPKAYSKYANRIYNFEFRKTDVVVLTFPKCGTTWAQEIIWTMRNNPNLDHPWASRPPIARSPFMDFDMLVTGIPKPGSPAYCAHQMLSEICPGKNPNDGICIQLAESVPDPRTLKAHLPFSLMSKSMLDTCKVVYVARDPKDVVVSLHHFYHILDSFNIIGSFEDFVDHFLNDDLTYSPYWLHLREAWKRRNHPNLHIIFYEDVKKNVMGEIDQLNKFLGTNLTGQQMKNIAEYTSFDNMKQRDKESEKKELQDKAPDAEASEAEKRRMEYKKKEGGFFRKGVVGDWKNKFTPEMNSKVDRWIRDHLSDLGPDFRYKAGH